MSLLSDLSSVAVTGLTAIKTAVDTTLGSATSEIPTLTGDAATFAQEYVEQHVGGVAGGFLKSLLGLAGPAISAGEAQLDNVIGAGLATVSARIDADLANVTASASVSA